MATYSKRGYKTPKEKEVKEENTVEDVIIDEQNSTTAEVFSKLDETASKTEDWIAKNQKIIIGFVGAVALATIGYLLYNKFINEPQQIEAAEEMFVAQQNFEKATAGVAADSLYKLALNGSEGKYGFIKIASEYAGTDAGNLANYYAGMAFLNTGKFTEAIDYLSKFRSNDLMLNTLATGAIGDAHAEKGQKEEALSFYTQASEKNLNDYTTPRFLLKAGKMALELNKKEEALKYFETIKETYPNNPETASVDALIGLSQK